MKSLIKNFVIFLLTLFIYFLPSLLFPTDIVFYDGLNKNFVPGFVFIIVWIVIYVLLSYLNTYYLTNLNTYNKKELINYFIIAFFNYLCMFTFPLVFFVSHSLFLGYIVTLLTAMTSILLSMQSLLLNKKLTLLTIPLILWSTFATVYSIILYLNN